MGLRELGRGIRIGDDAATDVNPELVADQHPDPDRDREIERTRGAEIAERAAVRTAPARLELVDDLDRAALGCAGDRTAGERRAQQGGVTGSGSWSRADPRHLVIERGELDDVTEI